MALFKASLKKTSLALIDIDSASVGVALAQIGIDGSPTIYYTVREFTEAKEHENSSEAMLRTLEGVSKNLVSKGAPILRKETGSGHIDRIIVSIGAPWQKTTIRIEAISETKPFIFTQALLAEITRKGGEVPEGFMTSGESVIATLLNGYETPRPFGKKVTRADMIVLSSLIDKSIANEVEKVLRKTYHTHALRLTAFASIAYEVFRDIYPHEKDFLVLEVSGEATDVAFVKRGLLVDVATNAHGVNDLIRGASEATSAEPDSTPSFDINLINSTRNARFSGKIAEAETAWLGNIEGALQEAASRHALPRTLFLLTDKDSREYLKRLLDNPSMRSLWLTDEPLRVIAVAPGHFAQFVKVRGDAEGDVYLMLLALFGRKAN
jgi:hypothetical protein